MNRSPEERAQTERFEAVYATAQTPVMRVIERSVCGCEYGGNSWTTEIEARRIAAHLNLRRGVRLLDLGAGSGWPGLYLGMTGGCDVVLVDLPITGLKIAAARAAEDGASAQISVALADAVSLPFAAGAFDAISHSDLLCCLREKGSALDDCRRTVSHRGRMAFTVIYVSPGLSGGQYQRAVANGPEFVETDTDYPTLLAETDWTIVHREDLTDGYTASCMRQLNADIAHEDALIELLGREEYAERVEGWRSKLDALEERLLKRELFVTAPASQSS